MNNREIFFRAKALYGDWRKGNYIRTVFKDREDLHQICPLLQNVSPVEVDVKTLGQLTGLKDKNNIDIYEGDILKIINGWNDNEYITNVRYSSNVFCIDVQGFDYNVTPLGYLDEECIIEIIGNIHENPELLCTSQST